MKQIVISNGVFKLSDRRVLSIPSLQIKQKQSWAFVGSNGSGKSALTRALSDNIIQLEGRSTNNFNNIASLSFEQLQKLVTEEWQRNNTDLLSKNEHDIGKTTEQIIFGSLPFNSDNQHYCQQLAEQFAITPILQRRFKYLSTGETRKALLCRVLMSRPDLLILDEPFDGLDIQSRQQLATLLADLEQLSDITLILVLNRFDEIPDFISHIGILSDCHLIRTGLRQQLMADAVITQLAYVEKQQGKSLPPADITSPELILLADQPRIILREGYVHYNDHPIINGLNWQVLPGEHWQIIGPNGAGKSTLLSLITGDHPQGYCNDLTLFGRRRGSGETIWQIKQHIGYVSSSLHLDYRVNISVEHVILSGYFDSIGVYQAVSDQQKYLTQQWLALLGLSDVAKIPFQALSWGQQRLLLIIRALVKHPTLLILDEPLQGLDSLNRQLVKHWIDLLIREGNTQLIFVSHHAEDAPDCITHRLSFIPYGETYCYETEKTHE